jgi:hypothetical protein
MKKALSTVLLLGAIVWTATAMHGVPHANAAEAQGAQSGSLDNGALKDTLVNMGFEPKPLTKGYLLVIKRDTWTLNTQVVLSGDSTKIGLNANLGKVDDPDQVPAAAWRELLISNGDIDPSSFYFDKDQKKLYLHRSFDNRAVTPAALRKELDNFMDAIIKTADLWKFTK